MTDRTRPGQPWLLCDVGGVLVTRPHDLDGMAAALGDARPDARDRIRAAFDAHRDAYDLGASAAWFWTAVAAEAGSPPPSRAGVDALVGVETRRWAAPDADARAALERARAAGHRLAILSNAPHELADVLEGDGWGGLVEVVLTSARLGCAKPDARIWPLAAERLGAAPADIAFVDDRPENVAAARAAGFRAHVWRGPATLDAVLAGSAEPAG